MARLFDTLQFMQLAGITRPTMMSWQRQKFLPSRKIGNAFYFLQEDLDKVPEIKAEMRRRMGEGFKFRKNRITKGLDNNVK